MPDKSKPKSQPSNDKPSPKPAQRPPSKPLPRAPIEKERPPLSEGHDNDYTYGNPGGDPPPRKPSEKNDKAK